MTDKLENLQSICEYGLLFTYNPLEAADTLFGSKEQAVASFAPGGMICLTELPYCDARDLFGSRYGVAVTQEWAEQIGARPVVYIDSETDAEFTELRDQIFAEIKSGLPPEITEHDDLTRWLMELAVTKPAFAQSMGVPDQYATLRRQALWFQRAGYREEREWRIRSGDPFINIEDTNLDKTEQRDMLLNMVKNIKGLQANLARVIPPNAVDCFYVPKGRRIAFAEFIKGTQYHDCKIACE